MIKLIQVPDWTKSMDKAAMTKLIADLETIMSKAG